MKAEFHRYYGLGLIVAFACLPMVASANAGGVDYSWGADALAKAHDFVVTMMMYIKYLLYAIGGVLSVVGALQIYIKMNMGKGDISESIVMLVGGVLFLIGASVVLPAFFGYQYLPLSGSVGEVGALGGGL